MSSAWVLKPDSTVKFRLFCFPYAGAGASIFREWQQHFPSEIEIVPVQLPGRESRIREAPFRRMGPLIETLTPELANLDKPFAFFGHSMGALIAYQLGCELRGCENFQPAHLFVSARGAPLIPEKVPQLYTLGDAELLDQLRQLNGTPEEIFRHPEFTAFWLRILRADLELCETYSYSDAAPLSCRTSAFGGTEDEHVERDGLNAWKDLTSKQFRLHMLPGDHFFLSQSRSILLRIIAGELSELDAPGF